MLPRIVRSPVDSCFGTSPSQAPKSRPFENASPVPIAATIALEMIAPIPGTVISRTIPLADSRQYIGSIVRILDLYALRSRLAEIHQFPDGSILETLHPHVPVELLDRDL